MSVETEFVVEKYSNETLESTSQSPQFYLNASVALVEARQPTHSRPNIVNISLNIWLKISMSILTYPHGSDLFAGQN